MRQMPAARALRVAVCGLGTAGAAAATLLARSGRCTVHVWERGADSDAVAGAGGGRMGAGIGLQPVGLRVLERMGLLEPVVAHGARLDSLLARTAEGRIVLDLHYASFDRRLFGVGLLREVLHRELAGAVIGENSVAVRYGESVAGACVAGTASANATDRTSRVPKAGAVGHY
jgi:2-polyprenyl-6-methoxyphenol hydroxylase-like FAD-dependent oxidoreductase